jgi:hypothetical protein
MNPDDPPPGDISGRVDIYRGRFLPKQEILDVLDDMSGMKTAHSHMEISSSYEPYQQWGESKMF